MPENLRASLDEMTGRDVPVETHAERLEEIGAVFPHSVRVLATPSEEFNCVMHALGLIGRFEEPSGRPFGRYYADTAFLQTLIDRGVLRPDEEREGAVVTWSASGSIRHVGLVASPGRAVSKWGIGNLYEHGLLEAPASYGSDLAFYGPADPEDAMDCLNRMYGVKPPE